MTINKNLLQELLQDLSEEFANTTCGQRKKNLVKLIELAKEKELAKLKRKEYFARTKDQRNEYYRKYREEKREKVRELKRAYVAKNKEKVTEYNKEYSRKRKLELEELRARFNKEVK